MSQSHTSGLPEISQCKGVSDYIKFMVVHRFYCNAVVEKFIQSNAEIEGETSVAFAVVWQKFSPLAEGKL